MKYHNKNKTKIIILYPTKNGNIYTEKLKEVISKTSKDKEIALLVVDYTKEKGTKWVFAKKYLDPNLIEMYDYVWLMDDDLEVEENLIDVVIDTMKYYNLNISQPSLTPDSFYSHNITLKQNNSIGRYTDFVEIMCPVYNKKTWAHVYNLIDIDINKNGWGYDFIQLNRMAIIDKVSVKHTRPIGDSYATEVAYKEQLIWSDKNNIYCPNKINKFRISKSKILNEVKLFLIKQRCCTWTLGLFKKIIKYIVHHSCCATTCGTPFEKRKNGEIPELGFWQTLHDKTTAENRTICALAPMADVTDCAFRFVIAKYGKPDVLWTEFVSADGLIRATEEGKKKLLADLKFDKNLEHPIVAQVFGSKPEYMEQACTLIADLGFDGIDINMGCPDKSIERQGSGASMIKNPRLAQEIIWAAKRGAAISAQKNNKKAIPISVKTRIGYNKVELDTWLRHILNASPAIVTIHARTRKEMSKVPANWDFVKRAVLIRNEMQQDLIAENKPYTLILGNGDVTSVKMANEKAKEVNADGVMIGRGIFGNPWLFSSLNNNKIDENNINGKNNFDEHIPDVKEKLFVMLEHTKKFEQELGEIKNFAVMKKHYKAYVNGFDGAKELRARLMETQNAGEVGEIVNEFVVNL